MTLPERTPDRGTGGRRSTMAWLTHRDLPVFFRAGGLETHLINNFAAFYVTGRENPSGHNWSDKGQFVKYVTPSTAGGGTQPCDPSGLAPCVAVLTP